MKKNTLLLAVSGVFLVAAIIEARQLTTPLTGMRGKTSWPQLYNLEFDLENDACYTLEIDGMGYYRSADVAYVAHESDGETASHDHHKANISTLLFGKSDFKLSEAFAGAHVDPFVSNNSFVEIATLKPRLRYDEAGALFSADLRGYMCWCDTPVRFGIKAQLPIRDINMHHTDDSNMVGGAAAPIGETIRDLVRFRHEQAHDDNTTNADLRVYAARLDFLSSLTWQYLPGQPGTFPLVNYHDAAGAVTIADQPVDGAAGDLDPKVALIGRTDGTLPWDLYWGQTSDKITATLAADGTGIGNDVRGAFVHTVDYTALAKNQSAQSTLFVVPTIAKADNTQDNVAIGGLSGPQIATAIDDAVEALGGSTAGASVADFIAAKNIDFKNGHVRGVGDVQLELYIGKNWGCEGRIWTDVVAGLVIPTAKKLHTAQHLIKPSLGNNGHTELFVGVSGGYDIDEWVRVMADASYTFVLKHQETIAAPFKGATVKNIGPDITADVKWNYFVGHIMASFFPSDSASFDIGYEPYYKTHDKVYLDDKATATDYAGQIHQPFDAAVITKDTKRIAHKIRAGVTVFDADNWDLNGGWSYIVAGRNVMREMEWYLRLGVNF